jgi:uncharacterized protein (TIGR02147 family)
MRALDPQQPPRLSDYCDYHGYLKDFYLYKKSQNAKFSFRRFASLAGIKSPNYLQLVMKKERRLSPEMAKSVAKAMKMAKSESDYFSALVRIELCQDPKEKIALERERMAAICNIVKQVLPKEKAEYFNNWYYPLIRELAFLPDFQPSESWITEKLGDLVTSKQAEKAIEILFSLGLWKTNPNGKVEVSDIFVDTGVDGRQYGEFKMAEIHKGNLKAWSRIIGDIPANERELGLINIPINAEKIPELKSRIQQFQEEIIGWLQSEDNPTQVVQLGTYLVPVTKQPNQK